MPEGPTLKSSLNLNNAEAVRKVKETTREVRGFGKAADGAGKQGTAGMKATAAATGGLEQKVRSLIGAYLGFRTVMGIINSLRKETEAVDKATTSAVESTRALMALSALKGKRPETMAQLQRIAGRAGRKLAEVGPAYYTLLGGTAGMAPKRQAGLFQQALLMAKTDPKAGLDALVNLFSTLGVQQPGLEPRQIGNLASQTIEQAKSTAGEMAQFFPPILSAAKAAGADVAVPAAMFSFGTRQGGGVAMSGTAMRALLLGLLAPAPETQKALEKEGMPKGGDIMARLRWFVQRGDKLPPSLLASLGGRRGLEAAGAIAGDPGGFQREVTMMRAAIDAPGSLLQERLAGMYGELPAQRYHDQIGQMETMIDLDRVKPAEMREQAIMKFRELIKRKLHTSPAARDIGNYGQQLWRWIAGKPAPQFNKTLAAMEALLEEGYQPKDIIETIWPYLQKQGVAEGDVEGLALWKPPGGAERVDVFRGLMEGRGATTMQTPQTIINGPQINTQNYYTNEQTPSEAALTTKTRTND